MAHFTTGTPTFYFGNVLRCCCPRASLPGTKCEGIRRSEGGDVVVCDDFDGGGEVVMLRVKGDGSASRRSSHGGRGAVQSSPLVLHKRSPSTPYTARVLVVCPLPP